MFREMQKWGNISKHLGRVLPSMSFSESICGGFCMKSKRSIVVLLLLAIAVLSVVPALTVSAQDSLIENLCLVTDTGKINDGTFNQFAYEGGKKAADEFGLNFKYIETVAATDYAKNIDTCVSEGFKAIITVGFLIADATKAAAVANPDV